MLREEEQRIGVVFGVVFFWVVDVVRCLLVRCWLGCRCRGDRGRGSWWLFESAAHEIAFHSISFRMVFNCGKPSHVAREVLSGCKCRGRPPISACGNLF